MISLIYLFDFHSFFRNNLQAWEIIMDRYTAQQRLALVRLLFHKTTVRFPSGREHFTGLDVRLRYFTVQGSHDATTTIKRS